MAGSNLQSPKKVRSAAIELPLQPIGTLNLGEYVFPHGLGVVPAFYSIRLRANKDLLWGIVKGMEFDFGLHNANHGGGYHPMESSWVDTVNIYFSVQRDFTYRSPDGTHVNYDSYSINPGDWDVVVRVMA